MISAATLSTIPGSVAEIRRMFLKGLVYLREHKIADFPEGAMEVNGKFSRFIDSDTESAWLGFRVAIMEARKLASRDVLPMDSAPLDGAEVLLRVKMRAGIPGKYLVGHYMQGGHCIEDHPAIDAGWYFWNGCMFDKASEPDGWMPLPIHNSDTGSDE